MTAADKTPSIQWELMEGMPETCGVRRPHTAATCEKRPAHWLLYDNDDGHVGRDKNGRWHCWGGTP